MKISNIIETLYNSANPSLSMPGQVRAHAIIYLVVFKLFLLNQLLEDEN